MISSRKQSCSFVTLQINSRRHDYLPGISVLVHAMKELNVARGDRQAMGKRSSLVTPLGGKVFIALALAVARDRLTACETSAPAAARKHMVR